MAAVLIGLLAKNVIYLPGVCQQQPSVTIIDETKGMNTGLNYSNDPHFKHYVATISQHFATKINQLGKCHYAELFFVYRPLISAGIKPFDFDLAKSFDTRSLDSPWVKMTFANSYKPIARAAFIWNERQFLLDQAFLSGTLIGTKQSLLPIQALLSGASAGNNRSLLPIDEHVFNQFLNDYTNTVVKASEREAKAEFKKRTPASHDKIIEKYEKTRSSNLAKISQRLPLDILWLLSSSRDIPNVLPTQILYGTIEARAEQYIELAKTLVNSLFSSAKNEKKYQIIFDFEDMFNIEKYRIN